MKKAIKETIIFGVLFVVWLVIFVEGVQEGNKHLIFLPAIMLLATLYVFVKNVRKAFIEWQSNRTEGK